jgi:hypothetical protein
MADKMMQIAEQRGDQRKASYYLLFVFSGRMKIWEVFRVMYLTINFAYNISWIARKSMPY